MRSVKEEKRSSSKEQNKRFDLSAILKTREKSEKRFTCINPKKRNISEFPVLKDSLPGSYDYHVCDYETIGETGDHVNFRATLRVTLSTKDDIKLWLKSHPVTWRVDRTDPGKGQKVLFKVYFRCQHKTRPRGVEKVPGRSKNTNCPAKMTVTLLRTQVSRGRQSRSTDPHVPTFPTIVTICSDHNHNIYVADAVPELDVADDAWREEMDLLMVAEEVHQAESEEVSHQAAAAGFAEMCQELSAMISSDSSFTASAVAAVNAFKNIRDNPSEIIAALHMFGCHANADLASEGSRTVHCEALHAQPTAAARSGGRRRLAAGRPTEVTAGPDHAYGQSA